MKSDQAKRSPKEKPDHCVWMQAGVIHRKDCKNHFDCPSCRFDRVMRRTARENNKFRKNGMKIKGKRRKIVFLKDKLNELPQARRSCLHHMKKRIEFRACTNDYVCGNCEFDQFFYDQYTVHAIVKPVDVIHVDGFKIPQGYYLHPGHAWAKIEEGNMVRIGVDDFVLRMLGPPDFIDSPLMGKEIKQGLPDIQLHRGPNKASILSPVGGIVIDINSRLREQGRIENDDPYSEGWVIRVHAKNLRTDIKNLMIADETGKFIKKEVDLLYETIEETLPLAADGGQLGNDIYGHMPQIGWKKLTKRFLRS